ncbi:MAG: DUF5682 family protein [Candidatus Promineifilaceae bacterium]|nr:DUF5682 family protein [Candidatus Promineifilaceae bacterium]
MSNHHLFGIRHHGPGSARALIGALEALRPDSILIEGPPDGDHLLPWLIDPDMSLPVALIIYRPDQPKRSGFYPYTLFSPELQAIRFALARHIPVRFADLPQKHLMAGEHKPAMPSMAAMKILAEATGHRNYETWWNLAIEQRRDSTDLFQAIFDLMSTLRASEGEPQPGPDGYEPAQLLLLQREAFMRQAIRQEIAAGRKRIAFVCGAWHTPALVNLDDVQADARLTTGLPAVPVEAAWVPWTYGRLSMFSGYGAGILSPGWYHHLWTHSQETSDPAEVTLTWLTRVADLLRQEDLDASSANVIEAVRLAETLAALRELPFPGLPELNEATQAVLCQGASEPLKLIRRKLIVGERLGMVPPGSPMVPLQRDLYQQQKILELPPNPETTTLQIDLRDELGLARSHLLHRLNLLSIPWGIPKRVRGLRNATYEDWKLQWQPDFALAIVEASMWGNTVEEAASAFAEETAANANNLASLTELLDRVLLAELPAAAAMILSRLRDETALSSDIPRLMAALPPLAQILRYGSVRQTDQELLEHIVDTLLTRICIGLPTTCAALDDNAAEEMSKKIGETTGVIHTLREHDYAQRWFDTLEKMADQSDLHGLIRGRICRMLLDESIFDREEAAGRLSQALGRSSFAGMSIEQAIQAVTWLDGFLQGSELLIVHDRRLWAVLDSWISGLPQERFVEILPLLRRAFSHFSDAARGQLHERLQYGAPPLAEPLLINTFDQEQADKVLLLLATILGLRTNYPIGE